MIDMDDVVGETIRLYVELGDPEIPVPRLRCVLEHLGVANAAVAVAAMTSGAGGGEGDVDERPYACSSLIRRLAPFLLLLSGANLIYLSTWVSCGPASRRGVARAIARASVPPLLLSLLIGAFADADR